MSEKKKFGKFLALATAAGAVAAGVSYFLKYRSFHKELDQDFHDFEHEDDDDFDGSLPHESEAASRTYVTLGEKKEETKETAKEAVKETAKAPVKAAAPKAEAKKPVARRTKKAAVAAEEVFIQYAGKEFTTKDLVAEVKKAWTEMTGKKEEEIQDIKVYVKTEENKAYYVVNGEAEGHYVEL